MPKKLQAMKDTFTMQATENKVFPIGGAFYTSALHPEEIRSSTLTEWTFFSGQTRIPESMAPKFVSGFSTRTVIHAAVPAGASGVLYCVGGLAGGFTVYMDEGALCAEYNTLGVYRYKARSQGPIAAGDVTIEVDLAYAEQRPKRRLRYRCASTAKRWPRRRLKSGAGRLPASETFDIGIDLGSPVSLDYHDRRPSPSTARLSVCMSSIWATWRASSTPSCLCWGLSSITLGRTPFTRR